MSSLTERVQEVIAVLDVTQREFASSVGLDAPKLSKALRGGRRFRPEELDAIARRGGVTIDWLVHGIGRPPHPPSVADTDTEEGRRAEILDAAWKLIARHGYHQVRMADIARACGSSTATVHYWFPSKSDVLQEAMRYCVASAFARIDAELEQLDSAHDRLLRLVELQLPYGRVHEEWSLWMQFWTETSLRPEMRVAHHELYSRWHRNAEDIVRQGQRQGVFRAGDPAELSLRFTALVDGLGVQVMTGAPGVTAERMRAVLTDFVTHELLA